MENVMKELFLLLLVGVLSPMGLKQITGFGGPPTTTMSGQVNGVPGSYWESCSNCTKKNGNITCKQCKDHNAWWTHRQTTIKIDSTKKLLNCDGILTYDSKAYGC